VPPERLMNAAEMVRMMMPVDLFERHHTEAKEATDLPPISAGLHEPRRCGVAQRVRDDVTLKANVGD